MHIQKLKTIPWTVVNEYIVQLQYRIYKNEKKGFDHQVLVLQKILKLSWSLKVKTLYLFVKKKALMLNQSKKFNTSFKQKYNFNINLNFMEQYDFLQKNKQFLLKSYNFNKKLMANERISISKKNSIKNEILISQNKIHLFNYNCKLLFLFLIIQAQWEVKFDPHSFGSRPKRSYSEIIKSIFENLKDKPQYIFHAEFNNEFIFYNTKNPPELEGLSSKMIINNFLNFERVQKLKQHEKIFKVLIFKLKNPYILNKKLNTGFPTLLLEIFNFKFILKKHTQKLFEVSEFTKKKRNLLFWCKIYEKIELKLDLQKKDLLLLLNVYFKQKEMLNNKFISKIKFKDVLNSFKQEKLTSKMLINDVLNELTSKMLIHLKQHENNLNYRLTAQIIKGNNIDNLKCFFLSENLDTSLFNKQFIFTLYNNILLNGIEIKFKDSILKKQHLMLINNLTNIYETFFIRYKNQIVVLHPNRQIVNQSQNILNNFLYQSKYQNSFMFNGVNDELTLKMVINDVLNFEQVQNLKQHEISDIFLKKIRISHTIFPYKFNFSGFDFLGFHFFQYKSPNFSKVDLLHNLKLSVLDKTKNTKNLHNLTKHKTLKNQNYINKSLKYLTVIRPSKANLYIHLNTLRYIIKTSKTATQENLIYKLAPKIYSWSNYYKIIRNKKISHYCDFMLLKMLWKWACRRHPNKNRKWIKLKYFQNLNGKNWVFCVYKKTNSTFLCLPNH